MSLLVAHWIMSELTSEQQQRIEENKKRAKERLSRKRPLQLCTSSQTFYSPKIPHGQAAAHAKMGVPRSQRTQIQRQALSKWSKNRVGTSAKDNFQQKKTCVVTLQSRTRFKAVSQYDSALIDLYKKISSKTYDATTYTWSFNIDHYHELVKSIETSLPHVQLSCIPKPVISLFLRNQQQKVGMSSKATPTAFDLSRVDDKLVSTLMNFQRQGVEYCIAREGRALIADDMGLGKTLQAICVACYYRQDWPILVVCPASVKTMWAEAFKCWVPSLDPSKINVVTTTKCSAICGLVNIISYDILVKKKTELEERHLQFVIADESHFLKNYATKRSKATLPLIRNARRALLMSGTPALSRPIELFTQISALDKSFKMKLTDFGIRYCNGVQNHFGWDFSGESNMHELSMYLEEKIMIRRMKVDVLDELPSKRRQMVILDMPMLSSRNREWKELKQELERVTTMKKPLEQKSALLPLFVKSGILKIPAVSGYILDLLEGRRKLLVFAHHKRMMDAICDSLERNGQHYIRIDGNTLPDVRQSLCDHFQHNGDCLVAVLSITAANTGLTLTAASTVVFAELFWNPGVLVQAEDRAYRIGQKDSVNIHYLIAQGTADDFIWPLIQNKLEVLTKAGLAGEDFSKADSTTVTEHNPHRLKQATIQALFASAAEEMGGCSLAGTWKEAQPSNVTATTDRSRTVGYGSANAEKECDSDEFKPSSRTLRKRSVQEVAEHTDGATSLHKRHHVLDDAVASSTETAGEGEEAMWDPGNFSEGDASWLDDIGKEILEDDDDEDFCIT